MTDDEFLTQVSLEMQKALKFPVTIHTYGNDYKTIILDVGEGTPFALHDTVHHFGSWRFSYEVTELSTALVKLYVNSVHDKLLTQEGYRLFYSD